MELILIIAVVVIAVLAFNSYRRTQLQTKQQHQITAAELEAVKRTADEDITRFGEELQDLDLEMVGKDLGDGARQDYQRALDSYESAKQAVGQVTEADQIKWVETGSAPHKGQPYGDPSRPGGQHIAKSGGMPSFQGTLTAVQIQDVVTYERDGLK